MADPASNEPPHAAMLRRVLSEMDENRDGILNATEALASIHGLRERAFAAIEDALSDEKPVPSRSVGERMVWEIDNKKIFDASVLERILGEQFAPMKPYLAELIRQAFPNGVGEVRLSDSCPKDCMALPNEKMGFVQPGRNS